MAGLTRRKATDTVTGWTAEDIHSKIGGSLDAIKAALAAFGSTVSNDEELSIFQMTLEQPAAQPQPKTQVQTPTSKTNSKLTVEAFTGAVTNDVTSAKAAIRQVREQAQGELMTYAQQEIHQYQQFKEALPAALASFLSGAAWEPAVLTFDVSAEPVHQLAAGS